jgi:hypothetical protein
MIRWPAALLALVLLGGCSSLTRLPPPGAQGVVEVLVFCDSFHSGLVVPAAAVTSGLSVVGGRPVDWPWLTIHYGERGTMLDPTTGCVHWSRLAVDPMPGLVQVDRHPVIGPAAWHYLGVDGTTVKLYRFTVDAAGWQALQDRLRTTWIEGPHVPKSESDPTTYWPCPRDWALHDNCHDFTLDLLRAAGLPLRSRPIVGARQMRIDLDRAEEVLAQAGITVLSP